MVRGLRFATYTCRTHLSWFILFFDCKTISREVHFTMLPASNEFLEALAKYQVNKLILFYSIIEIIYKQFIDIMKISRYGTRIGAIIVYLIILIAIVTFLIIDTANSRYRLTSILCVIVLLGLGWMFSKHPGQASILKFII